MSVAAPGHAQSNLGPKTWAGCATATAVGLIIAALPTPQGLSRPAQLVLAVTAVTVTLWMFRTISNGIASILMIGPMIPVGVTTRTDLSSKQTPLTDNEELFAWQ